MLPLDVSPLHNTHAQHQQTICFVHFHGSNAQRELDSQRVFQHGADEASHRVSFNQLKSGTVSVEVTSLATDDAQEALATDSWVVRLHLRKGKLCVL